MKKQSWSYGIKALFIIGVFIVGVLAGFEFKDFIIIDHCLDQGGRWAEQESMCVFYDEGFFQSNIAALEKNPDSLLKVQRVLNEAWLKQLNGRNPEKISVEAKHLDVLLKLEKYEKVQQLPDPR